MRKPLLLVFVVVGLGCSPSIAPVGPPAVNPCEGQACGGQGTCAVVNGTGAVCVCKAGFVAEGLDCRAVVAGAECDGVTCDGLGVCLVVVGTPNAPKCECRADAMSAGPTTCLPRPMPDAGAAGGSAGGGAAGGSTAGGAAGGSTAGGAAGGGTAGGSTAGGAAGGSSNDPCAGVGCSARGQCGVVGGTTPICICNAGYVASGLACVLQGTVGGTLAVLAGALGGPGSVDGASGTRFTAPTSLVHDAAGNVYVGGQSIRKITPAGVVSTLAGLDGPGNAGLFDATGAAARFRNATHLVIDSLGNLFVFDTNTVRRVTPGGAVSTIARGLSLAGMAIDGSDVVWATAFCAQAANPFASDPCLLRITPAGVVTSRTLTAAAGVTLARVWPDLLTVSADGQTAQMLTSYGAGFGQSRGADVVTVDTSTGSITRLLGIAPASSAWTGTDLTGLCRDGANNVWVADAVWGRVWRAPAAGGPATLVAGDSGGSSSQYVGDPVHLDGPGASARLFKPAGLSCDQQRGRVVVADQGNHAIRAIATGTGVVTTLAGTPVASGAVDGVGPAARFRWPQQVVADRAGNWFVLDVGNAVIRKVTPAGVVSVFAGAFGMPGTADGTGGAARFQGSDCVANCSRRYSALAIDASDNLYVADRGPNASMQYARSPDAIRKVTPAGVVTTLASGSAVASNMAYDQFDSIAVDGSNGDVYFNAKDGVRRLRGGAITLVVNEANSLSLAVDGARQKLYLALNGSTSSTAPSLARYDLSGATPVLETRLPGATTPVLRLAEAGSRAGQLAVAPNGALLVPIAESDVILRVDPTFTRVDKVAGEFGARGVEVGPLPARLTAPTGVAFNAAGQFAVVMGRQGSRAGEAALLVTSSFTP